MYSPLKSGLTECHGKPMGQKDGNDLDLKEQVDDAANAGHEPELSGLQP